MNNVNSIQKISKCFNPGRLRNNMQTMLEILFENDLNLIDLEKNNGVAAPSSDGYYYKNKPTMIVTVEHQGELYELAFKTSSTGWGDIPYLLINDKEYNFLALNKNELINELEDNAEMIKESIKVS